MVPIARRMLLKQKSKFIITAGGIGFSIMLIMFITGIYDGVKTGATGYIANSPSQIWLCQKNSTNLLRSTSFLNTMIMKEVNNTEGVDKVEGILRIISTAQIQNKLLTLFIFGFESNSQLGNPKIIQGTSNIRDGEMIVDKSFAMKNNLQLGDSISIQNRIFRIAGICTETNAIVAQFSFTTLSDAQKLLGFPEVVSFIMVSPGKSSDISKLVHSLKTGFPSLAVYTKNEFIQNNLEEMQTGVLPILWAIGILAAISGGAVISLMLFGSILEKRADYAMLKAIGTSHGQLEMIVVKQSIFIAFIGYFFGLLLYIVLSPFIVRLFPEINLSITWFAAGMVLLTSLLIGIIGSIIPIRKLSRIYPAEVFRA